MKSSRFLSAFKHYYKGPVSDHFDGTYFFNPWNPKLPKPTELLKWKLSAKRKPWPKKIKTVQSDIPPHSVLGNSLRISFVGHSTMLIQTQGINILTDPIWSKRASPVKWLGPKRLSSPGITFEHLPKIDLILVSHNHYDHMDLHTIHKIWARDRPQIVTPLGNDTVIHSKKPHIPVHTLDWHESLSYSDHVHIYLEPAQHWSARGWRDRNKALWGAFVIQTPGGNIYFSGDTGYGDGRLFRQIREKFGHFRLALLPIGCYEPQWFMEYAHMGPEDAVRAYRDLGEPYAAPIHFQTFRLGDEGVDDPAAKLYDALEAQSANKNKFRPLHVGEAWFIPEE